MSLLMEALKKAEQAKRKVAEGGEPAPAAAQIPPPAPVNVPTSGLTLELTPTEPVPPKIEPVYPSEPVAVVPAEPAFTPMAARVAQIAEPEKPTVTEPKPEAKPEIKTESAPVAKPVTAPTPVARAAAAPAPPVIVPVAAKPQTSPSVPQAKAAAERRTKRAFAGSTLGVAAIAAILVLGVGGYWYYDSMSAFLLKQTTQGVPQTVLQAEAPVPEVEPVPAAPVLEKPNKSVAPVKVAPTKAPAKSQAAAAITTPVPAEVVAVPAAPQPISVSRNVDQTEIFNSLQQAYRHYQSGDDVRAQVLYARVLDHEEHNRDALLGLAAIAVRQRDTIKAQEIYNELLTLDPRDTVAQAGFVGVTRSLDPLQQEARVKQLLEQEPNAPHLLFTYATFLMQQQRWGEASRALQSAYQSQRDNPDYAFNLAVTFDHLGQKENALKFYRSALELSSQRPGNFRVEDVRRRMTTLQAPGEGVAP